VKRALTAFAAALSYFTIVPLGRWRVHRAPDAETIAALPYAGTLVGALAGACGTAVWLLSHRMLWTAIVAWIVAVVATGAIHIDGLLDVCDGLLASVTPQRRREIMHDPRHGTYAIVGMSVLTVVWISAIASLAPMRLALFLAFSETLARTCALLAAARYPRTPAEVIGPAALALALGLTALLAWLIAPIALVIAVAVLLLSLGIAYWMARRLDGALTGDGYGAIVCVCNAIALAMISAVSTSRGPGRFM
jgi:adenosylcobinamide-GDP ribazoletransferase